ncbi:hypothetical protein ATANTOWER_008295, partial [Ataeniobius toweri]|nr:hypothetical protein [Ataeniobius toweri]
ITWPRSLRPRLGRLEAVIGGRGGPVGAWEYCAPLDHQRSPFCKQCDPVTGVPDLSLIVQAFGGVFRSQPPVLRRLSVCPCVLVRCGRISNPRPLPLRTAS